MKTAWLFTVVALLTFGGLYAFSAYDGVPVFPVFSVIMNSMIMLKLIEMLFALLLLLILLIGAIQLGGAKDGRPSGFLTYAAWLTAVLGVCAVLYRWQVSQIIAERAHVKSPMILMIGMFEGFVAFGIAIVVAAIAAWINVAIVAKGRKAAARISRGEVGP